MNCCPHDIWDTNTGCCIYCGGKVQETATEKRITALEETVAKLAERIEKMEAAARRTLL